MHSNTPIITPSRRLKNYRGAKRLLQSMAMLFTSLFAVQVSAADWWTGWQVSPSVMKSSAASTATSRAAVTANDVRTSAQELTTRVNAGSSDGMSSQAPTTQTEGEFSSSVKLSPPSAIATNKDEQSSAAVLEHSNAVEASAVSRLDDAPAISVPQPSQLNASGNAYQAPSASGKQSAVSVDYSLQQKREAWQAHKALAEEMLKRIDRLEQSQNRQ